MTLRISGKEQIDADNITVKNKLVKDAAALSGSPSTGELAIDSADSNKLKWYDGTTWTDAGGGGGAAGMPANSGPETFYIDYKASGSGYSQFAWPMYPNNGLHINYDYKANYNTNDVNFYPFYSFGGGTVDTVSWRVGGGNGTTDWKVALYSANSDTGLPSTLLDSNNFGAIGTTTGVYSWSPAGVTLTAGTWYWTAMVYSTDVALMTTPDSLQIMGKQAIQGTYGNTVGTSQFNNTYCILWRTPAVGGVFDAGPYAETGWSVGGGTPTVPRIVVVYS